VDAIYASHPTIINQHCVLATSGSIIVRLPVVGELALYSLV